MNSIKSANQILQRTSEYIQNGVVKEQPAWYRVLAHHPPKHGVNKEIRLDVLKQIKDSEVNEINSINDKLSSGYFLTRIKPQKNKNSSSISQIMRPQELKFIEDELRSLFYKQHPWELADPKNLVENEHTIEAGKYNWENIRQFTKKLDGESVVQRSIYLIESQDKSILDAYEQSKFEYYQLKIQDEIDSNVAREQGEMFGSVYPQTHNEKGILAEDAIIAKWKVDSEHLTEVLKAKMSDSGAATVDSAEALENTELTEDDILKKVFN